MYKSPDTNETSGGRPEGSELNDGEVAVRLGCLGCAAATTRQFEAEPQGVLGQLSGTGVPYEIKGEVNGAKAMWTRSGNADCATSAACPYGEDQLLDLASQLTNEPMSKVATREQVANFTHEDHPEGAVVIEKPYPQELRDQVVLDFYDNDIKDGDSNAAYSFRYGEHEGEIFDDAGASDFWEVYPHTANTEPVLFHHEDTSVAELDFVRDAVLQTLGIEPTN